MIAIIDYGLGNIKAFGNIFNKLNIPFFYAQTPDELKNADKIILPGVGAFDHAMTKLNESGLRETLDYLVLERRTPVIGICVGMQMMANSSEEGSLPGLGWIDGTVKKFSGLPENLPLPHMGWNEVKVKSNSLLFDGLSELSRFYFLHSYYFDCKSEQDSIAESEYGTRFTCLVNHGNVYGIQCHPEKSHQCGITILKNFAELPLC